MIADEEPGQPGQKKRKRADGESDSAGDGVVCQVLLAHRAYVTATDAVKEIEERKTDAAKFPFSGNVMRGLHREQKDAEAAAGQAKKDYKSKQAELLDWLSKNDFTQQELNMCVKDLNEEQSMTPDVVEVPTETESESDTEDQGRADVHGAYSIGNMSGMLKELVGYSDSLSADEWVFKNPEHQTKLNALLNHRKMHECIDAMLSSGVMQVAVSSKFADIKALIEGWKGFDKGTIERLGQAAASRSSLITCASLNLYVPKWPESFAKTTGNKGATLVIPVCPPDDGITDLSNTSCFYLDTRGFVVFKYNLENNISVVLTHIPSTYKDHFTLTQLLTEHATDALKPLTGEEYRACEFHSIEVRGGTESLGPIQGISQGDSKIIAVEGITTLEINKWSPLNLSDQAAAVMSFRGKSPTPPPAYQMFEKVNGLVWFNNCLEVQKGGVTVYAKMISFEDTMFYRRRPRMKVSQLE